MKMYMPIAPLFHFGNAKEEGWFPVRSNAR